ncbi:hypothetical protein IKF30_00980 [Candidatus Saccharibacteria bacterium]|nr:hypothetical protein [Candidatus Saccharibacteria bacterium]
MDGNLAKIRHERSRKDFPDLQLDDGEYVEFYFKRAKICLWMIMGSTFLGLVVVLFAFLIVLMNQTMIDEMGRNFLFIILSALLAAALIISWISLRIYNGNKLFITNKHVIQLAMTSLVASSVNVIDLASVEDASFAQTSLMQKLFQYGTFRLSTVGDETTYTFTYSDITPSELKAVTELITAAKAASRLSQD